MRLGEILKLVDIGTQAIEIRTAGDNGSWWDAITVFASHEDGEDIPEDLKDMTVLSLWVRDYETCEGREPPMIIDVDGQRDGGGIYTESGKITFNKLKKLIRG